MPRRSDEEPDVDELPFEERYEREQEFGAGHCERCGVEGHVGDDCPTIVPYLLRTDSEERKSVHRQQMGRRRNR